MVFTFSLEVPQAQWATELRELWCTQAKDDMAVTECLGFVVPLKAHVLPDEPRAVEAYSRGEFHQSQLLVSRMFIWPPY